MDHEARRARRLCHFDAGRGRFITHPRTQYEGDDGADGRGSGPDQRGDDHLKGIPEVRGGGTGMDLSSFWVGVSHVLEMIQWIISKGERAEPKGSKI